MAPPSFDWKDTKWFCDTLSLEFFRLKEAKCRTTHITTDRTIMKQWVCAVRGDKEAFQKFKMWYKQVVVPNLLDGRRAYSPPARDSVKETTGVELYIKVLWCLSVDKVRDAEKLVADANQRRENDDIQRYRGKEEKARTVVKRASTVVPTGVRNSDAKVTPHAEQVQVPPTVSVGSAPQGYDVKDVVDPVTGDEVVCIISRRPASSIPEAQTDRMSTPPQADEKSNESSSSTLVRDAGPSEAVVIENLAPSEIPAGAIEELSLPRETTEIPETGPLFHAKKVILKVGSPQTLEEPGCREIHGDKKSSRGRKRKFSSEEKITEGDAVADLQQEPTASELPKDAGHLPKRIRIHPPQAWWVPAALKAADVFQEGPQSLSDGKQARKRKRVDPTPKDAAGEGNAVQSQSRSRKKTKQPPEKKKRSDSAPNLTLFSDASHVNVEPPRKKRGRPPKTKKNVSPLDQSTLPPVPQPNQPMAIANLLVGGTGGLISAFHDGSLLIQNPLMNQKKKRPVYKSKTPAADTRSPLKARPPVWAESRQELCENLPYFRSYQGGVYFRDGRAHGYLMDGHPSPRDVWADGGRVVISHGGGKTSLDDQGESLQQDQRASDQSVRALLACVNEGHPVAMIVGEKCQLIPFKPGDVKFSYAVLGWYTVTHGWPEPEPLRGHGDSPDAGKGYLIRYKFRFQWVESQGEPWWLASGPEPTFPQHEPTTRPSTPVKRLQSLSPHSPAESMTLVEGDSPMSSRSWGSTDSPVSLQSITDDLFTEPMNGNFHFYGNAAAAETESDSSSDRYESESDWEDEYCGELTLSHPECDLPETPAAPPVFGEIGTDTQKSKGPLYYSCPTCNEQSVVPFKLGGMCLNAGCVAVFQGLGYNKNLQLDYDDDFLTHFPWKAEEIRYDIRPCVAKKRNWDAWVKHQEEGVWEGPKGWHCENCGRLSSRELWSKWRCLGCGEINLQSTADRSILPPPPDIQTRRWSKHKQFMIVEQIETTDTTIASAFSLPSPNGTCGTIYHIRRTDLLLVNALFTSYLQEADIGDRFKRHRLRKTRLRGFQLAQHFSFNAGADYRYALHTETTAMNDSPECVQDALQFITSSVWSVIKSDPQFNEILSVGYLEGQKMGWHSDGERGLGNVVASLSLGAPALMKFRRACSHNNKNHAYDGTNASKVKNAGNATLLTIELNHGDILIMHGTDIQKYYEHTVIPQGLRFAATARQITADH